MIGNILSIRLHVQKKKKKPADIHSRMFQGHWLCCLDRLLEVAKEGQGGVGGRRGSRTVRHGLLSLFLQPAGPLHGAEEEE